MGLEDIPEMQIMHEKASEELVELTVDRILQFHYNNNFITVRGDDGKNYIFSVDTGWTHPDHFRAFMRSVGEERHGFNPMGGGKISIDKERILLYGDSTIYGKYKKKVVQPIVKRWAKKNLPNHRVEIK